MLPDDWMGPTRRQRLPGMPGDIIFGRVLTPDADQQVRYVVTLHADQPGGPATMTCAWIVTRAAFHRNSCSAYPVLFGRDPFTYGVSGGGSGAFVNVHGFASDDVERLEALLADRQTAEIPLPGNVFAVELPRANLPAFLSPTTPTIA